ncbi:MAG: tetratricopeptide repeat protein [Acidobacteriota bacterium]
MSSVVGEQEYVVSPLELPQVGEPEKAVEEVPSVALFLERARAADREFRPRGRALDDLAEICRRLDGLPLAIELAAAHVKVLSIPELCDRLGKRLDLLRAPSGTRPSRHQTLELALGWSYDLLDEDERGVLRRLSVFAGGFDLSAAERVCRAEGVDVLQTVTSLLDKSLVTRQPTVLGDLRFGLLEITRTYAGGKLDGAEEARARNAHADWVLELARRGEQHLAGGDQKAWLARLDAEYGNVLAALHWARSGGGLEVGLETAAALVRYWSARGIYREGRSELEALLANPDFGSVEPKVRARASTALGLLSLLLGDYASATETLERSLEVQRSLDDPIQLAHTLNHLAWVNAQGYELDRAETLSREALGLHRENRVERGISVALNNLSWIAQVRGEVSQAEEFLARALNHRRAAGDERGVAFLLINLAVLRLDQSSDLEGVQDWLAEARAVIEPLGDPPLLGWLLSAEGALEVRSGEAGKAVALLDRSIDISRDSGSLDGRSWGLFFKAEALRDLGRLESARSHFEEMRELWSHLGSPSGVARALAGLAEIDRAEDKSEEARDRYRQCLEIFERLGARRHVEACRRWLAEVAS